MVSVNLISEDSYELEKFLSSFYNSSFDINDNLNWEHKYSNPVELAEIIGAYVDNFDDFNIVMWVSLDKGVYINVTTDNADSLIKYLYERYPYWFVKYWFINLKAEYFLYSTFIILLIFIFYFFYCFIIF